MSDIKPCTCGKTPTLKVGPDLAKSGNEWLAWVECDCGERGSYALHSELRAVNSWNAKLAERSAK